MMTTEQFGLYCRRLPLTDLGRDYLSIARNGKDGEPAAPSRSAQNRVGNIIVRYPSIKNRKVFTLSSRRVELAISLLLENDDDVLEFWSEPPTITLEYEFNGRVLVRPYHPDFLVLRRNEIQLVEGKTADSMPGWCAKVPGRYQKAGDNLWCCKPGEHAANELGFTFRVWTDAEFSRERIQNLKHLDWHLKLGPAHYAEHVWRPVFDYLCSRPGISAGDLGSAAGVEGINLVKWMLAHRLVFCDLDKHLLKDLSCVRVYPSAAVAKAMEAIRVPEPVWPSVCDGAISTLSVPVVLQDLTKVLLSRGQDCLEDANRKLAVVMGRVPKEQIDVVPRTVRLWRRDFRKNGYLSLCDRRDLQGNREPRVDSRLIELRDEYIQNQFLKPPKKTVKFVYNMFRAACRGRYPELEPPSYKWFRKKVRALKRGDVLQAQMGNRAAYPFQFNERSLDGLSDSRGDYPFMNVHCDHTQLSIFVVSAVTGRVLGKPWLTLLIDDNSRAVLAIYLSLDDPTRGSLMMILRDCVLRHGRLPFGMVVDNGSDFQSTYFQTFTGAKGIWVTIRPPHHPKFGNPVENFFGMTEGQFIAGLEGSSHIFKTPRIATKSVDPLRRAIYTMAELYSGIDHFCFTYWNGKPHKDLGISPADALKAQVARHGVDRMPGETWGDDFLIQTMLEVPRRVAHVYKPCGVYVRGAYFHNPSLAAYIGRNLPCKWDPMDPSRVFIQLPEGWVPCFSKFRTEIAGLPARDVQFFAQDLRQRAASIADDVQLSDTDLGAYFRYLKETREPALLERRDRARENHSVRAKLLGQDEEVPPKAAKPDPAPQTSAPAPSIVLPQAAIPAPILPPAEPTPLAPLIIRKKSPNVL